MSPEVLVALFSGTGIATVIGVIYQIIRERRGNVQRDLAGDLTLGELFRSVARKEVAAMQTEVDELRITIAALRATIDRLETEIRSLRAELARTR
jgi:ubiquinone biosynthesis protein UbiJ